MQKFSSSNTTRQSFYFGWLLCVAFCAGFFIIGTTNTVSAQLLVIAKEKKEIDKQIPAYKKEIVEKCGDFKFELEVDYDSFAEKADVLSLVPTQGIKQGVNALRRICTDSSNTSEQDKTAAAVVRKRINLIVFIHIPDPKKKNIDLTKDGILYVRNSYGTPSGIIAYVEMARDLTKIL